MHGAPSCCWIGIDSRLLIEHGTCAVDATPCPPAQATAVLVRAVSPTGEQFARRVATSASDDLLKELQSAGWHVESVD
jgi:hypothetical protein